MYEERHILNFDESPDKDELNKVSSWVRYHKRDYKIIVNDCLDRLSEFDNDINILATVSQLIIDKDIDINRSLIVPLSFYIEKDFPQLKGKLNRKFSKDNYLTNRQMFLLMGNLLSG